MQLNCVRFEEMAITSPVNRIARSFDVRVPASASNLGAGFDFIGMAVDRWLELTAHATDSDNPVAFRRAGTLTGLDCKDEDDLIWRGFVAACVALRRTPPRGIEIDVTSAIPVARGLGSSASAIVAGVLLANTLFDGALDEPAMIDIAASLEGHPDNVAPSVLGGAVLSVRTSGHNYHSARLAVHSSLRFVFLVPDFEVRTSVARAALPSQLAFETAVGAAARAAALVVGLQSGDAAILKPALDDVLHVPFRRSLITGYDTVTVAAIAAGAVGATLSGSGSTIVAVATETTAAAVREAALSAWKSCGVKAESFVTAAELRGATVDTVKRINDTKPPNDRTEITWR
jgi:homoserine kinase